VTLVLVLISRAGAHQFAFPESASKDPATLSKALVTLAGQALAVYKDDDREKYLVNLSALQSLEGQYLRLQAFVECDRLRLIHHPCACLHHPVPVPQSLP
jgi:hypothetical protein